MHQLFMEGNRIFCLLREYGKQIILADSPQELRKRTRSQSQILYSSHRETDFNIHQILQQTASCNNIQIRSLFIELPKKCYGFRRILNLVDENKGSSFFLNLTDTGIQHIHQVV